MQRQRFYDALESSNMPIPPKQHLYTDEERLVCEYLLPLLGVKGL